VPFDVEDASIRSLIVWNGLVFPAAVSAALLLVSWPLWRRAATAEARAWPLALAIGLGYAVGQVRIEGWRPFPPREAADRLWYLTLVAVLISVFDLWRYWPTWLRWGLRASLWLAVVWSVLPPAIRKEGSQVAVWAWFGGLGLAGLIFWAVLAHSARRQPGALVPPIVLIVSTGTAGVLHAGHSLKLTQLAGIVAATLLPVLIRSFCNPPAAMTTTPVAVLLPGLWLLSYFYSDDAPPVTSFALLALATLCGGLGLLPKLRSLALWRRSLICVAFVFVLTAVAVWLAHRGTTGEAPVDLL
jgi:hypothetical protein